jgi:RNA polymerase sigma factor for flagellar operon FliA
MYEVDRETEIIKYLPLVERVVKRMSIKTTDYEQGDLFNIGVIGLMDALRKFDPAKKVPFESYAVLRIKGAIIDEVRKHAKISRYKMAAVNQFYQARQDLEQTLKREATDTEIAKKMGISRGQLADIYDSLHYLASVSLEDTLFSCQDEGMTISDSISDKEAVDVEESLLEEERPSSADDMYQKVRGKRAINSQFVLQRRINPQRNCRNFRNFDSSSFSNSRKNSSKITSID